MTRGSPPLPPKKPSGAQNRKARRKREVAAAREERKRQALAAATEAGARAGLGPPPEDTVGRIEWASSVAAAAIYEVLTDPVMALPQRAKLVLEGVRALGMTGVKALYEERLKTLEAKVYGRSTPGPDDDGLEDLSRYSGGGAS